jgi:DNA (cytosine-5)-methyltransferase 1
VTKAYYNEIDPKAAQWLKNLIACGEIANGDVDTRSIEDVKPDDLKGYTQCHFFAGIGGWSYALRLAGWPDDRPVWTGSCPCQPFSAAGKGKGFADERHLWPAFHWLIEKHRPDIVFGEQVASKDGLLWFDLVSTDLEGSGYACATVDTCAARVKAAHTRQRLYWVADTEGTRRCWRPTLAAKRPTDGTEQAQPELRGYDADFLLGTRENGRGSSSTLNASDVCAPSYGIPGRMGFLRGYGNALVPQQAADFISAYG